MLVDGELNIVAVVGVIAVIIIAVFSVGFIVSSFFEYRQAKLKGMADLIRHDLLQDANVAMSALKEEIAVLKQQIATLQQDLIDTQQATNELVATLQSELQTARQESLRNEEGLFQAIRLNQQMGAEAFASVTTIEELHEQIALLRGGKETDK